VYLQASASLASKDCFLIFPDHAEGFLSFIQLSSGKSRNHVIL
jgi:hypothetical protein